MCALLTLFITDWKPWGSGKLGDLLRITPLWESSPGFKPDHSDFEIGTLSANMYPTYLEWQNLGVKENQRVWLLGFRIDSFMSVRKTQLSEGILLEGVTFQCRMDTAQAFISFFVLCLFLQSNFQTYSRVNYCHHVVHYISRWFTLLIDSPHNIIKNGSISFKPCCALGLSSSTRSFLSDLQTCKKPRRWKSVFTSSLINDLERDTFQYQNMAMFIQIWEKPCPATFYHSFQANSGKCSPMDIYALDGNYQDWWYINCLIFLLLFSFSKLALEQPKVDVNTWESRVVLEEIANNLKRQCKLSLWHFACD